MTEVTLVVKGERLTFSNRYRASIFRNILIAVSKRKQLKIFAWQPYQVRTQGVCGTIHFADLTESQIVKVKEAFKVIADMGTRTVHVLSQAA